MNETHFGIRHQTTGTKDPSNLRKQNCELRDTKICIETKTYKEMLSLRTLERRGMYIGVAMHLSKLSLPPPADKI